MTENALGEKDVGGSSWYRLGDEVQIWKELFHDVSPRVDNDLENNYERLIEHAEKLCARRDDILAQAKTKQLTQACEAWISRVMKIEKEVQELETKYKKEKSKKRTFNQLWNGSSESRAELNKSMAEKCEKWHNLWLEGKFEIGMVVKKLPERDWSLEKLQHSIAARLKLNMEGMTDPNEIAQQIRGELKSKRCLLLLDEVWEVLDLPLIGMYDNEKDSKVVLATRHRHVCYDMETDEEINVQ
uniref:NB-ARC domain-containing protein n=1 Tax=Fagus sylvatica TaxID=28930 RepID=A0A2N9G756_FAGSY